MAPAAHEHEECSILALSPEGHQQHLFLDFGHGHYIKLQFTPLTPYRDSSEDVPDSEYLFV